MALGDQLQKVEDALAEVEAFFAKTATEIRAGLTLLKVVSPPTPPAAPAARIVGVTDLTGPAAPAFKEEPPAPAVEEVDRRSH